MNLFKRAVITKQLETKTNWDVIIIGGGATGLGVALDSVTRGFKTLLLEQDDFAKGTSSRSTKLVHGGVRYLAQGNIDLVKEALYERGLLLKNAPHLVKNQSFIIPGYSWWSIFFYTTGLKIYEFLSGKLSFGKSVHIAKKETKARLQTIKTDKLKGGVVYHDGQFDDSRLAINIAQTCLEHGATVLNHFKVKELIKDDNGTINGVVGYDTEANVSYELHGKVVVNATGVFTDDILKLDTPGSKNMVRPSQGVHLVLDKSFLPGNDAIMIPKTEDNRVLFLVPWHDKVVVGTTDTLLDEHNPEPVALEQEVDFILATANSYLTKIVTRKDVLSVYAGLRPLAAPKDKSEKTKEISRSHKIVVSPSGMLSVIGGKWTTYRKMGEDTIDKAIAIGKLPPKACTTQHLAIHGAMPTSDRSNHLYIYGSDWKEITALIEESPDLGEKLHPRLDYLKAEVVWAIRHEMARTIEDILARRVRVLFVDARAAIEVAPMVAGLLAEELHKDYEWQQQQTEAFTAIATNYVLQNETVTQPS
ncbi:glycerol-3-phosphate dehydrogenase/oxidase [Fulvivirga sp. M361]|uniref:glycerol-3-phosphate dehydrogenase/oxidase n=1 Tax=Fulvivirga sp. M361 TaxID=2594266 RepID=UPI00117AE48C|nr:glycerol-3-phosphate dehydrogenase/oxidase [Fulvivirga sp. M361]TRX62622.1 glycerol-3-phosphate dehydrogenase/oxidase [Fulvivirga sp. M361]